MNEEKELRKEIDMIKLENHELFFKNKHIPKKWVMTKKERFIYRIGLKHIAEARLIGFQEGRKQTLKEVEKMINKLENYIIYKVDLEDRDKEYHQIMNKINQLKSKIKDLKEKQK